MAEPQRLIAEYLQHPRLLADHADRLADLTEQRKQVLQALTHNSLHPCVIVAEADPIFFVAGVLAACATACPVFLGNPKWVLADWQQVMLLVQPDVIFAATAPKAEQMIHEVWHPQNWREGDRPSNSEQHGWMMIPTGGSSGQIRFAIHTWETLTASVQGFQQHFQLERIHSCCVLPLYHVSGLMQLMRCLISGGMLALLSLGDLAAGLPLRFAPSEFVLSLVPTQLQRLLQLPAAVPKLAKFQTVLLGGAAPWPDLLETARAAQIRLAPTYGMTETASQIATLRPDQFLSGCTSVGTVLPHASISIGDAREGDRPMSSDRPGKITIRAASLALGYYPDRFAEAVFQPDDVGFLDASSHLHIMGRSSDKIITGGEKVFPAEVEAAIRATGLVDDVVVIGVGDRHWGQVVTAIYVPQGGSQEKPVSLRWPCSELGSASRSDHPLMAQLMAQLTTTLSPYKRPKRWIAVSALPRNAQGKLNHHHLQQIIQNLQQD